MDKVTETKKRNFDYYAHSGNGVILKIQDSPSEVYQGVFVVVSILKGQREFSLTGYTFRFTRTCNDWHDNISELEESDFDNAYDNLLNPEKVYDYDGLIDEYKKWLAENNGNSEDMIVT